MKNLKNKMPKIEMPKIKFKASIKKYIITIVAVALILAGTGAVYGTLKVQSADRGTNPVVGMNTEKKQVLVQGDGYSLSKDQAKDYDLPVKEKTTTTTPKTTTINPVTRRSSITRSTKRSNIKHSSYKKSTSTKKVTAPTISTNLSSTQTVTTGDTVEFWVEAKNYNRVAINKKYYTVTLNGKKLTPSGSATHASYKVTAAEGTNTVVVKVKDLLSKKTTTSTYKIIGKTTKPTKTYDAAVAMEFPSMTVEGADFSLSGSSYEGKTYGDVLKNALSDKGYTVSIDNGEIKGISFGGNCTITIDETVINEAKAEELGITDMVITASSLKKGDITDTSTWEVTDLNGDAINLKSTIASDVEDISFVIRFYLDKDQDL